MDYNPSHSQLLIRKHKVEGVSCNVDILFKGMYSLNIPVHYEGLSIYMTEREINQTSNNVADRIFVFKLIDNLGSIGYIDASALGVFENDLNFSDSSLGEFTWSSKNVSKLWVTEKDYY